MKQRLQQSIQDKIKKMNCIAERLKRTELIEKGGKILFVRVF